MNFFIVTQNENSKYGSEGCERYHFPTRIPNGKKIAVGDVLMFSMSKSDARKNGDEDIKNIRYSSNPKHWSFYSKNNKEQARKQHAEWFVGLEEFLSFDEIGGDPRNNISKCYV